MANSLDSSGNFVITPPLLATDWSDLIAFYKSYGLTDSTTQTKGGQILASDWETLRQTVSSLSGYTITVPSEFVKGNPIVSTTWGLPVSNDPTGVYQYTTTTTLTIPSGITSLTVNWLIAAGTKADALSTFSYASGSQGGYYEDYTPAFTVAEGDVILATVGLKPSANSTLSINGKVVLTATGGVAPDMSSFSNGSPGTPNGKANTPTPVLTNTLGSFGGGGSVYQSGFNVKTKPPTYGYIEIKLS